MKEVYATRNPAEAHLVRGLLESEGIRAVVDSDILSTVVGEVVAVPSVSVDDADLDRALMIVRDWLASRPEGAPWECPKCGETIAGQFTACWECGTQRPS